MTAVQTEHVFPGCAKMIPEILSGLAPKKLLLIHREGSFAKSGAGEALRPVVEKYRPLVFTGFKSIPLLEDLKKGLKALDLNFDLVLAVGGGAALDMAKLLALFSVQEQAPEKYILEGAALKKPMVPLVAVPTTSGSGSEATHFAVCYANGVKYSVAHPSMLPCVAVVDGELTMSMPRSVAASTGLDAFSQAVESYWSIHSTEESRAYAREAAILVLNNLIGSVNGGVRENRIAMAKAAHLAGKAINITRTTTPHALSYYFTLRFGVAHGHAVALTLGELLEFNALVDEGRCADPRGAAFVTERMAELLELMGCRTGREGKKKVWELMEAAGLERDFRKLGIGPDDFKKGLDEINWERAKNNPRSHSLEELELLFAGRF